MPAGVSSSKFADAETSKGKATVVSSVPTGSPTRGQRSVPRQSPRQPTHTSGPTIYERLIAEAPAPLIPPMPKITPTPSLSSGLDDSITQLIEELRKPYGVADTGRIRDLLSFIIDTFPEIPSDIQVFLFRMHQLADSIHGKSLSLAATRAEVRKERETHGFSSLDPMFSHTGVEVLEKQARQAHAALDATLAELKLQESKAALLRLSMQEINAKLLDAKTEKDNLERQVQRLTRYLSSVRHQQEDLEAETALAHSIWSSLAEALRAFAQTM